MNSHRRGPSHGEGVPVSREADQNNTCDQIAHPERRPGPPRGDESGASESQPTQPPKCSDHQVHPEHDDEHPEREA